MQLNAIAVRSLLEGKLQLSWKNPDDSSFLQVHVLRRADTPPMLMDDPLATIVYVGTDELVVDSDLVELRWYYYTWFIEDTDNTILRSASTYGFATKNYHMGLDLFESLPTVYQESDNGDLEAFCEVLGGPLDFARSMIDGIAQLYDIDTAPPEWLQRIAKRLSWDLDLSMPLPVQRMSLKAAPEVKKWAGTKYGLNLLVKSNSGYPFSSGIVEYYARILFTNTVLPEFPSRHKTVLVTIEGERNPDLDLLGTPEDPFSYTYDNSIRSQSDREKFGVYVQTDPGTTQEEMDRIRVRLTTLINKYIPMGVRFDVSVT